MGKVIGVINSIWLFSKLLYTDYVYSYNFILVQKFYQSTYV